MEFLTQCASFFYIFSTIAYFGYLFFQKSFLYKSGYALLFIGFICHTASIGYVFLETGQMPVQNLYETLSLAGWAVAFVFLLSQIKFNLRILGVFAAPLVSIIMVTTFYLPKEPVQIKNVFNSIWLTLHVISIFLGEASLALACGTGLLYLIQENAIKNKHHGFFFKRLPSLDRLDTTGYACIIVGFTMLTIGLITGFIYAKSVWGKFWSWDPKEIWAGITWILYAVLLHERLVVGWRGRRAAILSIIGFTIILFTFFGVNFLLKGHHGVFTKF